MLVNPDSGEMGLRTLSPVALGMVLVVLSFAVSLGYSHFLLQPIDEQALAITEGAVPSLRHLANMRVELARLGRMVRDLAAGGSTTSNTAVPAIGATRERVESEFRLFRDLPASSAESQWVPIVDRRLGQLRRATDSVVSTAGGATRRDALQKVFEPALEQTDAATGSLQRLGEAQARAHATRILQTRQQATFIATLLGCVSLGIAFVATFLVLRVLRTRAEITQRYVRLQSERNEELEAFAGRVAHDLRDPLGAIALQMMAVTHRQQLKPELTRHFDAIDRQLVHMNQVIEALLEFARAGAAPAADARADLAEVLSSVLAGLRPRLETIQVELTVTPVRPCEIACTAGALSSVLANLLGNAAKFVVEGAELPRRIAVRVSEEAHMARVEVEDNGPGIPPEAEQRIFEPFRRLNTTRQSGFGLGLATVKKIVEAYHGRLGVWSRHTKGSIFWFELPKSLPVRN
ncbi:MAG TPA: HAMP domain-containing sensor histidine kinase [Steroidobacteraceae bacterium]